MAQREVVDRRVRGEPLRHPEHGGGRQEPVGAHAGVECDVIANREVIETDGLDAFDRVPPVRCVGASQPIQDDADLWSAHCCPATESSPIGSEPPMTAKIRPITSGWSAAAP